METEYICHDSEDPIACRGGRKLYYTAYGDPICNCPVGQYPFPRSRAQDDCVTLFTQGIFKKFVNSNLKFISRIKSNFRKNQIGPCPLGQVLTFSRTGTIRCSPAECQFNGILPLALYRDGFCYTLGSQGPCQRESFQLFGYDVFRQKSVCVDITALPYFVSEQEVNFLDNIFVHLLPEYDDYRVSLVNDPQNTSRSFRRRNWKGTSIRRQGSKHGWNISTFGQFPGSLIEPLPTRSQKWE